MARWNKLGTRGNVSDRRGIRTGTLGILGTLLMVGVGYLFGVDPLQMLFQLQQENLILQPRNEEDVSQYEGYDSYEEFATIVVGSLDEYWNQYVRNYREPTLVLFRDSTSSGCGRASSFVGPHYCPLDEHIYLDETFFEQLQQQFGAQGGDLAEAYVIAHEVGHHVQNVTGNLQNTRDNEASIETELTADCYAGAWLGSLKGQNVFEPNELYEALDAAAAVGDDNIQQKTQGSVRPETWTHGSSESRKKAFLQGYQNPDNPERCGL